MFELQIPVAVTSHGCQRDLELCPWIWLSGSPGISSLSTCCRVSTELGKLVVVSPWGCLATGKLLALCFPVQPGRGTGSVQGCCGTFRGEDGEVFHWSFPSQEKREAPGEAVGCACTAALHQEVAEMDWWLLGPLQDGHLSSL